ncbi:glyoxalase [Candidatus Marinamargulisbacteria bacterium SCGC AG-414-C22]|nr:glyoxalase [Candidatus Marinamargulisbacteria bacterium SCGC AG-414-C22]
MINNKIRPFHLALSTKDIQGTKKYYTEVLELKIGRQDKTWVDFDFFGHQLVFHESLDIEFTSITNDVDRKKVVVPHFGIVLKLKDWHDFSEKLIQKKQKFIIDPYIRFKGTSGEQATMFFLDNNKFAIEVKAFKNDENLFRPFEKSIK